MIDDLTVAKTATFFAIRKKLSTKAVEALFVTLRATYGVSTNNIFKHKRELYEDARRSAICFSYESLPSFLDATSAVR